MDLGLVEKLVEQGLNKAQAAIDLKVPRSGIPELDAMIRESRRLDIAAQVLAASGTDQVNWCFRRADALLAASEKEQMK